MAFQASHHHQYERAGGNAGPVPELDFPEGSDMMSDLRSDPDGGRRMEFELYTRLSGHEEASMPH